MGIVTLPSLAEAGLSGAECRAREELAFCYRLAARLGWTDLIYTHISMRIPGTEHFLINQFGLLFEEITPENLVRIDLTGNVIAPADARINLAGYVIHGAIHEAKREVACLIHTHSKAGMALSALDCGLLPLTQHACRFYNRIAYHEYEGIVLSEGERPRLIKDLGNKRVMILKNHGFLTAGRTVGEAFTLMFFLEKAASAQLAAQSTNQPLTILSQEVAEHTALQFGDDSCPAGQLEWEALKRYYYSVSLNSFNSKRHADPKSFLDSC